MRPDSRHVYWCLIPVGAVVLLDEWFKYLGLHRLPDEGSLVDPGVLSLAIHKNLGLAFNIPFRLELIVLFSVLIGAGLFQIAYRNRDTNPNVSFATLAIILGAMGNLYDRLVYGFTVDYLIFFGRSAINLSDVVIVSGVVGLLLMGRRSRRLTKRARQGSV